MALTPTGDTDKNLSGYGIHGTWLPETIGTESSNGCIRMKNEEVNELYSILPYKTEVTIED
jgi:lipoprotein-anchoring transpeptidase ErfK/SrfK